MKDDLKSSMAKLSGENRKIIRHMSRYLGSRHLNEVCFRELLSDIVGMALESQERGEKFSDTVGMDYEPFCRELAANTPRQSFPEQFLASLTWGLYSAGLVVPLLYIFTTLFPKFSPAVCSSMVFITPISYFVKYTVMALILVSGRFVVRRGTYKSQSFLLAAYLMVFMLSFIVMDNLPQQWFGKDVIHIHLVAWIVIFACLAAFSIVSKRLTALGIAYRKQKKENGGSGRDRRDRDE